METGEKDMINENGENIQNEKNTGFAKPQMESYYPEELSLNEEIASESDVFVDKKYSLMSIHDLLDKLKNLVDNLPFERIRKDVEAIKDAFYKKISVNADSENNESDSSGALPDVSSEENEFEKYLEKYREKKYEYVRNIESLREENYKQKLAIIEELKELINEEEDLNLTFQKFHDIQNRWKEIARMPQNHAKDLWDTWHYNVEKFYDYVKINRELRDLDFKRNMEAKTELVRKAEALLEYPSVVEAFGQLQQYHDAWHETGPVPRDQRDLIWERFKEASYKLHRKHQAYFEQLKRERQHNIQMKIDLCERAEKLNSKDITVLKDWQKSSSEMSNILEEWKAIGFVPKKENAEIYNRLKKSRDDFFSKRNAYYKMYKQGLANNLQVKKELCEKAKALSNSEDWQETAEAMIELQKQWQQTGPVPHKFANSLWTEFRDACDTFFKRKHKHAKKIGNKITNLKKKEALIVELENFAPSRNDYETIEVLKKFRQRWDSIGFVPSKEKERIQLQFFNLLDGKYKQLKLSDAQRRVVRMKNKVETSGSSQDRIVISEREKLFYRIAQLENEISLLDNNIGFFASSKNADSMIADVRLKISKAKEEIHSLEEQIRLIDKEFE
ncbi:MAG: DUF349 domain-containing protein [Prevotellaceae bacterium]|jgi:hypothetical protein|nr:DUF349 domain-containing protein [Prevotellaceae bacterium]